MKKILSAVIYLSVVTGCSTDSDLSNRRELPYSSLRLSSSPVVYAEFGANGGISSADKQGRFYACKEGEGCQLKFKRPVDLLDCVGAKDRKFTLEKSDKTSPTSLAFISGSGDVIYKFTSTPGEEIYGFATYKNEKIAVGRGETMCVELMNYSNGELLYRFCVDQANRFGVVGALKFNPQGDKLAVAPFLSECHIWDIKQKKVTRRIELPDDGTQAATRSINEIEFSPDAKMIFLATGSTVYKSAITLFSVEDGIIRAQSEGIQGVIKMQVSPDGRSIAAIEGGWKTRILLLDANTLKIKQVIMQEEKEEYYFSCLDFAPDGKRLLVGDSTGEIRVYEIGSK